METTKRELSLYDFFEINEENANQNYNQNYNDERVAKNQQHYGHRKRIKP